MELDKNVAGSGDFLKTTMNKVNLEQHNNCSCLRKCTQSFGASNPFHCYAKKDHARRLSHCSNLIENGYVLKPDGVQ